MIDLSTETIISLTEAARWLPCRREGKRPNVATLYRWARHGVRGVVLETIQVGGTKCTSIEALQRFCDRLTPGQPSTGEEPPFARSRRREKEKEAAERQCAEAGL